MPEQATIPQRPEELTKLTQANALAKLVPQIMNAIGGGDRRTQEALAQQAQQNQLNMEGQKERMFMRSIFSKNSGEITQDLIMQQAALYGINPQKAMQLFMQFDAHKKAKASDKRNEEIYQKGLQKERDDEARLKTLGQLQNTEQLGADPTNRIIEHGIPDIYSIPERQEDALGRLDYIGRKQFEEDEFTKAKRVKDLAPKQAKIPTTLIASYLQNNPKATLDEKIAAVKKIAEAKKIDTTKTHKPSFHYVVADNGKVSVYQDGRLISGTGTGKIQNAMSKKEKKANDVSDALDIVAEITKGGVNPVTYINKLPLDIKRPVEEQLRKEKIEKQDNAAKLLKQQNARTGTKTRTPDQIRDKITSLKKTEFAVKSKSSLVDIFLDNPDYAALFKDAGIGDANSSNAKAEWLKYLKNQIAELESQLPGGKPKDVTPPDSTITHTYVPGQGLVPVTK